MSQQRLKRPTSTRARRCPSPFAISEIVDLVKGPTPVYDGRDSPLGEPGRRPLSLRRRRRTVARSRSHTGKEPMSYHAANPLIVQGDRTVLLEVDNPLHAEARDAIAPFAELEKSPEHIHTYRLTPLSLWNAAAAGMSAESMVEALERYSKFPIPANLPTDIHELVGRYGRVSLVKVDGQL